MPRFLLVIFLLLALTVSAPALAGEAQPEGSSPELLADLPTDALLVEMDADEGSFTRRMTTADGMVAIVMMQREGAWTLGELLANECPDASDIVEATQGPVGSYPAARASFTTGENEDTRQGVIVALSTDTDSLAFVATAPADAFEEARGQIEQWISTLYISYNDVKAPEVPEGLRLTADLPEDAQPDGGVISGDTYTLPYLIGDGMVRAVLARREEPTDAQAFLAELYPDAADVQPDQEMLVGSYPADRLSFTTGENEDTRQCVMVAFSTDTDSFAFAAEVAADSFEDYQETVEGWIASLDVIDG